LVRPWWPAVFSYLKLIFNGVVAVKGKIMINFPSNSQKIAKFLPAYKIFDHPEKGCP